ncbi:MAG: carbohydrate deacetylase [Phycisphaerae bacterium]
MPTSVIVNADDFGFSAGVTDAIIDSHRCGILTSTTLICTMPDAERAAGMAKYLPGLGVGIHLCLTQGTSKSQNLRLIASPSADGRHASLDQSVPNLIRKVQFSRAAQDEAQQEWRAQIEWALAAGIKPTHLDSHKHIHHWPVLRKIAIELAKQYNIGAIRCAREIPLDDLACGMGYRVLSRLAGRLARVLAAEGIATTDWFYGLAATGKFSEEHWLAIMQNLPAGVGEIMVHPGRADGLPTGSTRLVSQRELEWRGITAPAVVRRLRDHGIELKNYSHLTAMP